MKSQWLERVLLRAASLAAPADLRDEWLAEWTSELWYVPRDQALGFSLGAFRDVLWVRRNHSHPPRRAALRLDSPVACLAFLAILATLGIALARLPLKPGMRIDESSMLRPIACVVPAWLLARMLPWAGLRRWTFLMLKIGLVLTMIPCGIVILVWIGFGPLTAIGLYIGAIAAFRWMASDQRRRCKVCLRLLTEPVRIGCASQTLLAWYGLESMCARGHGLLHAPEITTSYAGEPQWLTLDGSWSELFSRVRP